MTFTYNNNIIKNNYDDGSDDIDDRDNHAHDIHGDSAVWLINNNSIHSLLMR